MCDFRSCWVCKSWSIWFCRLETRATSDESLMVGESDGDFERAACLPLDLLAGADFLLMSSRPSR